MDVRLRICADVELNDGGASYVGWCLFFFLVQGAKRNRGGGKCFFFPFSKD